MNAHNGLVDIRTADWMVVLAYFGLMWCIAFYFARRNTSTEDYFVGGRAFPGWVVGMSMLATSVSSVTFLAFPAAAYAGDFRDFVINLMLPIGILIAVLVYIPMFRRRKLTSAYEYLGDRFSPIIRLYGMITFTIARLSWLGIILCLVSNVIIILTGWPVVPVIIFTGVFIALYTIVGGIGAVIWTDVLQSFVLLLGGLLSVLYLAWQFPGGLGEIIEIGHTHGKFSLGPTAFQLSERTVWTVIILGCFSAVAYHSDQNLVQRYVAAKSTREARKATILYGAIAVPTWAFFFFLGTCLFAYFQVHDDPQVAQLSHEQVFPYFILTRLPPGVAGVVVAGVLSAAMSSVDSTLNAIAAVTVVDIVKPYLAKDKSDRFYLNVARATVSAASVVMVVVAVILSGIPTDTINELDWAIGSLFAGCVMGIFLLGFFTTRVDHVAALVGLVVAVTVNIYLVLSAIGWLPQQITCPVHEYWTSPLVNVTFMVVAYGTSWFRTHDPAKLAGLTVWTMMRQKE